MHNLNVILKRTSAIEQIITLVTMAETMDKLLIVKPVIMVLSLFKVLIPLS